MKYLSLFSGIGGFELAIGKKAECVGFSEIDKYAIQIYQKHFPKHKNYGDITKIDAKTLPNFDFLVGGFPCQSFSIAGKRGGFADTRGTLFFEIARILKEKQPRLLLLENVKGLLSHDQGRTFFTIISTLDELGYDIQWQVLNSKNHGVPQNRERIFIVGHLRGTPRPKVFPIGQNDEIFNESTGTREGRPQTSISHTLRGPNIKADQSFIIHNVYGGFGENKARQFHKTSPTIRTAAGGGHIPFVVQKSQDFRSKGELRTFEKNSPTIRANMGDNHPMIVQRPRGNNKGGNHKIAPTMTGHAWKDNNHLNGIRRLTPVECERLQSFPDNWTKTGLDTNFLGTGHHADLPMSDTQRYKTLGNAVTVNVIKDIMERFLWTSTSRTTK